MKTYIGIITVALAFIGYIPYLRDTFKGRTKPHPVSWFTWGLLSLIVFGIQVAAGAGSGSYSNLAMGLICLIIFLRALKNGQFSLKKIDIISFLLALTSIFFWLVIQQPQYSISLLILIDLFSFIPTFIKTWIDPFSETLITWEITLLRQLFVIISLQNINFMTLTYPLYCAVSVSIFCLMLVVRRFYLK